MKTNPTTSGAPIYKLSSIPPVFTTVGTCQSNPSWIAEAQRRTSIAQLDHPNPEAKDAPIPLPRSGYYHGPVLIPPWLPDTQPSNGFQKPWVCPQRICTSRKRTIRPPINPDSVFKVPRPPRPCPVKASKSLGGTRLKKGVSNYQPPGKSRVRPAQARVTKPSNARSNGIFIDIRKAFSTSTSSSTKTDRIKLVKGNLKAQNQGKGIRNQVNHKSRKKQGFNFATPHEALGKSMPTVSIPDKPTDSKANDMPDLLEVAGSNLNDPTLPNDSLNVPPMKDIDIMTESEFNHFEIFDIDLEIDLKLAAENKASQSEDQNMTEILEALIND